MFDSFAQYLAYGATDQHTVRELLGDYDGLLVPGTVAAFQREGTGGFVLSLSAASQRPSYVIDPRFPLFQQLLVAPKKSHEALAQLLGDEGLIATTTPVPSDFPLQRTEAIAQAWLDFNTNYRSATRKKFDKYAARLNEEMTPAQSVDPAYILPPYLVAGGVTDPWWEVACAFYDYSAARDSRCVRVVATEQVRDLDSLLAAIPDERVAIWVSGLEELMLPAPMLADYARAVRAASDAGKAVFAVYGGFFHVLLSGVGLRGCSHGIGYGEYRAWRELPQSGPPPARYYLRRVHRYVSQDLAYQLYLRDRSLVECDCAECAGRPPIALDYHSLMKHSVRARAEEIRVWANRAPLEAAEFLDAERAVFDRTIPGLRLPAVLRNQAERCYDHLSRWVDALRSL